MKRNVSRLFVLMSFFLTCCSSNPDTPIGNGFFLRASGMTAELHPTKVSIFLKRDGRTLRVWNSLTIGFGGPFPAGDGVLFCARDEANRVALFVADQNGMVAEITGFV